MRIRVVGVCDSKWMLATPNVLKTELDDQFLTQVCKLKSSGSPLVELASFGTLSFFFFSFSCQLFVYEEKWYLCGSDCVWCLCVKGNVKCYQAMKLLGKSAT